MDDTTRRMTPRTTSAGVAGDARVPTAPSDTRRADEIREEIEQTRDELAETVDAIQERLQPRNLMANATEHVKAAAAQKAEAIAERAGEVAHMAMDHTRDTAGGLLETIRENPYPAALIGVGLAWLLSARGQANRRLRSGVADSRRWSGDQPGASSSQSQYRATGWTQDAQERATEFAHQAQDYASESADALRRSTRRVGIQLDRVAHENPLLIGGAALMLGAAFGMAIPETESENQWLGDARDSVVLKAQQLASDAASTVQETASDLVDAASKVVETVKNPAS